MQRVLHENLVEELKHNNKKDKLEIKEITDKVLAFGIWHVVIFTVFAEAALVILFWTLYGTVSVS